VRSPIQDQGCRKVRGKSPKTNKALWFSEKKPGESPVFRIQSLSAMVAKPTGERRGIETAHERARIQKEKGAGLRSEDGLGKTKRNISKMSKHRKEERPPKMEKTILKTILGRRCCTEGVLR